MSYIALATDLFDDVASFYGDLLGFPLVAQWDRPHGRGRRYDLGGLRLEILDNTRECPPLELYRPGERTHIVIEVDDIELARSRLPLSTPEPQALSWGARLFQLRDPDGVPVTFLQWKSPPDQSQEGFDKDSFLTQKS
jgi:catechol 2,3-dioxygenase-like lactoylglutathione lyase family enzyme